MRNAATHVVAIPMLIEYSISLLVASWVLAEIFQMDIWRSDEISPTKGKCSIASHSRSMRATHRQSDQLVDRKWLKLIARSNEEKHSSELGNSMGIRSTLLKFAYVAAIEPDIVLEGRAEWKSSMKQFTLTCWRHSLRIMNIRKSKKCKW